MINSVAIYVKIAHRDLSRSNNGMVSGQMHFAVPFLIILMEVFISVRQSCEPCIPFVLYPKLSTHLFSRQRPVAIASYPPTSASMSTSRSSFGFERTAAAAACQKLPSDDATQPEPRLSAYLSACPKSAGCRSIGPLIKRHFESGC